MATHTDAASTAARIQFLFFMSPLIECLRLIRFFRQLEELKYGLNFVHSVMLGARDLGGKFWGIMLQNQDRHFPLSERPATMGGRCAEAANQLIRGLAHGAGVSPLV
jgi:hypothetical protein